MTIEELEKNIATAKRFLNSNADVTVCGWMPGFSEVEFGIQSVIVQLDNDGVPRLVIRPTVE